MAQMKLIYKNIYNSGQVHGPNDDQCGNQPSHMIFVYFAAFLQCD